MVSVSIPRVILFSFVLHDICLAEFPMFSTQRALSLPAVKANTTLALDLIKSHIHYPRATSCPFNCAPGSICCPSAGCCPGSGSCCEAGCCFAPNVRCCGSGYCCPLDATCCGGVCCFGGLVCCNGNTCCSPSAASANAQPTSTNEGGAGSSTVGVPGGDNGIPAKGLEAKDIGGLVAGFVGLFIVLGGLILWRTRKVRLATILQARSQMSQVARNEGVRQTRYSGSESQPSARVGGDDTVIRGGRLAETPY